MRREILLRVVFVALLGGGLLLWTRGRQPRDLILLVDLTSALPGDIVEVDVVVRRGDHALARHDVQYGKTGAPGQVEMLVHASPGDAEVETTLVYAGKPARKWVAPVKLNENTPARIRAQ